MMFCYPNTCLSVISATIQGKERSKTFKIPDGRKQALVNQLAINNFKHVSVFLKMITLRRRDGIFPILPKYVCLHNHLRYNWVLKEISQTAQEGLFVATLSMYCLLLRLRRTKFSLFPPLGSLYLHGKNAAFTLVLAFR